MFILFLLCSVGGFRLFSGLWREDCRQVHPGPCGSHQMEEGENRLGRKWRSSCQEGASESAVCSRWRRRRCSAARHLDHNRLWGAGGGAAAAADAHLHCASHHVHHLWVPVAVLHWVFVRIAGQLYCIYLLFNFIFIFLTFFDCGNRVVSQYGINTVLFKFNLRLSKILLQRSLHTGIKATWHECVAACESFLYTPSAKWICV